MGHKHVILSGLTVVLLAVAVCFRFYGDIILHPNEFLFGANGDGLKNYFSVAYQVVHGEGLWFNGMLYPYGDHLIFADGQPLLTKVLSWFIDPEVSNGPQVIGIMNLLMIFSIVISAWCIHRLLVWSKINPWFSIPFALAIAFLSPQIERFSGHYALGYTFIVPVCWLLLVGIFHRPNYWLWAILFSLFSLLSAFIHPYYVFISAIFIGACLGWELLMKRFRFQKIDRQGAKLLAAILPVILFMAYQKWVDIYTDRPSNPGGILEFVSSFSSVFVPVYGPLNKLAYSFSLFNQSNWEGNAYVGLVATFIGISSLILLPKHIFKRGWKAISHPVLPDTLKTTLVPATLTLFLAMGVFHHLGLFWLSDFVSPLKQFRSLGRISWIFYYVFSVWAVYKLWVMFRFFKATCNGLFAYHAILICVLSLFVWSVEAVVNIKTHKKNIIANRNAAQIFGTGYADAWEEAGVNIDTYQGIVPLPFTLVGSEKTGMNHGKYSLNRSWRAAFSTGLPIVGGAMSRTSLEVTERSAQIVANPLLPRKILDDLNPEKELLLFWSYEHLTEYEYELLHAGRSVYKDNEYEIFALNLDDLRKSLQNQCLAAAAKADTLSVSPTFHKLPSYGAQVDELWGQPAYELKQNHVIFDTTFMRSDELIFSYWIKLDPSTELAPTRIVSTNKKWVLAGGLGYGPNVWDGWLLISDTLRPEPNYPMRYYIDTRGGVFSRFQFRDLGEDVTHTEGNTRFLNNIPINCE